MFDQVQHSGHGLVLLRALGKLGTAKKADAYLCIGRSIDPSLAHARWD